MMVQNNNKENFEKSQRLYNSFFKNEDHYGVREYWHGWAGNFHRYRIKILKDIFINTLKCGKETEILDIGSNVSLFGQIFKAEECPQVTAFDISSISVQKARKIHPHIKCIVGDAQSPSLKGKWDILFASEIIEHLANPKKALSKWNNLLKENGYLVLSTPNRYFSRENQEHISLLTINQVKKILKELNFEIIKIIGIDTYNPPLDYFLNKITKYIPKVSLLCDKIFQVKMRLTFKLPWLAYDIIYVAKKH